MSVSSKKRLTWLLALLAVLVAVALRVPDLALSQLAYAVERGKLAALSDELAAQSGETAALEQVSAAFRRVARLARPGVVHIRIVSEGGLSMASGVILDREGHILTNNHVVAQTLRPVVRLADEREFVATIVGTDPKTDLAVIKIDAPDLHPLRFGDSDRLEVGDWVLAVGAPFGYEQTVTHGIVSAVGRSDVVTPREIFYQNFIQTDAAINQGNSGGPLLNLRGEVVGINTAIATADGNNAGIAFTIPSNTAVRVAEQLRRSGMVERGWLGVVLRELSEDLVRQFRLPGREGAMVDLMYEGAAAHRAGLQCEDVIVELNGRPVRTIREIQALVGEMRPGQEVRFGIIRDGQPMQLMVQLDRQADDVLAATRDAKAIVGRPIPELGVRGRSLPLMRRSPHRGVVIESLLDPDSSAAADVRPREWIVACDGREIGTVAELRDALKAAGGNRTVALRVMDSEGHVRTVELQR